MPLLPVARHLPLVASFDLWDRVVSSLGRARLSDLVDLMADGSLTPLPPDTPVAIEEDHATLARVRVLAGASIGRTGWLPTALLPATLLRTT